MRISEGVGRTWRRRQNVFEGGNNQGWMERLPSHGLELREMVQCDVWGHSESRDQLREGGMAGVPSKSE